MSTYNPDRLNIFPVFSDEQQDQLKEASNIYQLSSFLADNRNVEELGIDFVYASSKLEGNTYSKMDTINLLKLGITAGGKLYSEARMILNLHEAYVFMLSQKGSVLNRSFVCDIHALLAFDLLPPRNVGVPRVDAVRISGTDYIPPVGANYLVEELDYLLSVAWRIDNPFIRSIYLKLNLCYLQFFQDVNKRTSRMIQNVVLLEGGITPLLQGYTKSSGYIEAIVHYYDTGDYEPYIRWFVSSYVQMVKTMTDQL